MDEKNALEPSVGYGKRQNLASNNGTGGRVFATPVPREKKHAAQNTLWAGVNGKGEFAKGGKIGKKMGNGGGSLLG